MYSTWRLHETAFACRIFFILSFTCCLEWLSANRIWANIQPFCGNVSSSLQPPYIPTTGTFRILIVFVQFQDDNFDSPPSCISDATNGWPSSLHAIPNWATGAKLVHSQATPPYTSGGMSGYYYVMSNDAFHLRGVSFGM